MVKYVYNIKDIEGIVEEKARIIISKATQVILADFKVYIEEYVYKGHPKNSVYYNPNGQEFKNAWEWKPVVKMIDMLVTKMWYNYSEMSLKKDFFGIVGIHGSEIDWDGDEDERPYLADVLNATVPASSLSISVTRKKAYWNTFISEYVEGGRLKKVIDRIAEGEGFKIK